MFIISLVLLIVGIVLLVIGYRKNDRVLMLIAAILLFLAGGLEDLVKGCGVPEENIWVEDSNNTPKMIEKLEEALTAKGVRVFITRHVCSLLEIGQWKRQGKKVPSVKVDPEKCVGCMTCIRQFGCPAFVEVETEPDTDGSKRKKSSIDPDVCRGCGVCVIGVCPYGAIYFEKE